jgi:hypothetical protein
MAMNLVRTGVAAVAGLASGALSSPRVTPLTLGTTSVSWGLIAEGVAVVGGAGLQFISPFTAPNLADGLVDGGIALLSARGANWAMSKTAPAAPMYGRGQLATRVSPAEMMSAARGAIGSVGSTKKFSLT